MHLSTHPPTQPCLSNLMGLVTHSREYVVHEHIQVCIHTCTHMRTQASVHTYTYAHTCAHAHIHAHTSKHTYIHTRTHMHPYTHAHTSKRTYIHTCTHTHMHTHAHTNKRTYIHTRTQMHPHMHIYIHTHSDKHIELMDKNYSRDLAHTSLQQAYTCFKNLYPRGIKWKEQLERAFKLVVPKIASVSSPLWSSTTSACLQLMIDDMMAHTCIVTSVVAIVLTDAISIIVATIQ